MCCTLTCTGRCVAAVKKAWSTPDACIKFWSTDYNDDKEAKFALMQKMSMCFKCSPLKVSSVVEQFHFGPGPAPASQDDGSGSSSCSSSSSEVHNLLVKNLWENFTSQFSGALIVPVLFLKGQIILFYIIVKILFIYFL